MNVVFVFKQAKNKDPPDAAPAMIERPKMSIEMWSAMKMHIMKQREKKKQGKYY